MCWRVFFFFFLKKKKKKKKKKKGGGGGGGGKKKKKGGQRKQAGKGHDKTVQISVEEKDMKQNSLIRHPGFSSEYRNWMAWLLALFMAFAMRGAAQAQATKNVRIGSLAQVSCSCDFSANGCVPPRPA